MDVAKRQAERTRGINSSSSIQSVNKNIDMESGMAKLKENERKVPVHCFTHIRLEK
jgi:hypothetical protein